MGEAARSLRHRRLSPQSWRQLEKPQPKVESRVALAALRRQPLGPLRAQSGGLTKPLHNPDGRDESKRQLQLQFALAQPAQSSRLDSTSNTHHLDNLIITPVTVAA